jgi:SAM-dependent methyltransferase
MTGHPSSQPGRLSLTAAGSVTAPLDVALQPPRLAEPLPDESVDVVISNCVINLSADKARVLAEAFRVLRPGGRLGISDVTADNGVDRGQLARAEQRTGCGATLTHAQYHDLLQAAGFTAIAITSTRQAGPGLHSAIIQAAKPADLHT